MINCSCVPSAISHHPSAFSPQPSSVFYQPSAFSPQPSSVFYQPSAFSLQPSAFSHLPSSIRHHPSYLACCPTEAKTDKSKTPISLSTHSTSYSLRQPINNHRVVPRYQNIKIIVGFCDYFFKPLPMWVRGLVRGGTLLRQEPTEKVHNVKWINNWTLLTGLLRNVKLLHIINAKYLRISLIFSTLAENFCYVRKLSTNPIK